MKVPAVVGLGYASLPPAIAFGKLMSPIGYDLFLQKIESYRKHKAGGCDV